MPSQNSWGKHGDELLNTAGITCKQSYTGVGFGYSNTKEVSGKINFSNYLSDFFPKFSTHNKTFVFHLLCIVFSPLSTPLIINETN